MKLSYELCELSESKSLQILSSASFIKIGFRFRSDDADAEHGLIADDLEGFRTSLIGLRPACANARAALFLSSRCHCCNLNSDGEQNMEMEKNN